jgi:hypothetical protein
MPQDGSSNLLNLCNTDNDVILAKKPLGGWSCGSCGTNINNMN